MNSYNIYYIFYKLKYGKCAGVFLFETYYKMKPFVLAYLIQLIITPQCESFKKLFTLQLIVK